MNTTLMSFIKEKQLESYEGIAIIGSYATGDEKKWSDIDLLVLSNEDKDEIHVYHQKYITVKYCTEITMNHYFKGAKEKLYLHSLSLMKIMYDPKGILNHVKHRSLCYEMTSVDKEHCRHLAKETCLGYLEEVQKSLQGLIDQHNGKMLAGLFGLTYGMFEVITLREALRSKSDNDFYDIVMNHLSDKDPIKTIAPIAFGIEAATLEDRVEAGLEIFIHVGNSLLIDMKENEKLYVIHLVHEIIKTI